MTPFLVAVMGVPAPTAVGTDLTFATLTKLTGSFQHFRQRSVNVEIAVFLGMGSIPAGLLGVGTLEWIKGSFDPARVESIMITIIAATLVLVGLSLIYRDYFMPERRKGPKPGKWTGKGRMSRRRRAYRPIRGPRRLPGRAHLHRLGERDGRHTASSLSHSAGRYSRHGYHTCDGPLVRRWHSPHDAGQRRLRPGRDPVVGQHPRCPYREPDGALDPRQAAQADTGHHADLRRCAPASRGFSRVDDGVQLTDFRPAGSCHRRRRRCFPWSRRRRPKPGRRPWRRHPRDARSCQGESPRAIPVSARDVRRDSC